MRTLTTLAAALQRTINYYNHREESKAVKAALTAQGIRAKVGHGTGTAWSWLEISLPELPQAGHERNDAGLCLMACRACETWRERRSRVLGIAQSVTGRTGDYNGKILVK